jgi:hypothetical protein
MSLGRPLVNPAFDLLLIASGLTFPVAAWLAWDPRSAGTAIGLSLPLVMLLVTQTHIVASSFRLYTKPGAFRELPFVTMALPLLTLAVLTVCIAFASGLGQHLWALALTWTPFHFSMQTFGIAMLYCHRSSCPLDASERQLLRLTCGLPFLRSLFSGAVEGFGIGWLVPPEILYANEARASLMLVSIRALDVLTFAAPVALYALLRHRGRSMPLLALTAVLANGIWFAFFSYVGAFVWANIFHGLQYVVLVGFLYLRDQLASDRNRHGPAYHLALYAGVCIAAGYAMHQCWPLAYTLAGFGPIESAMLVVAIVNVHHFIVDGYIWRLRSDRRYATAVAAPA